ncbi:MAG: hypothetical protein U9Q67_01765 [Patescibacteria group bacterium]|nr:hypothetical protein [Patescibacteria group bacterium]
MRKLSSDPDISQVCILDVEPVISQAIQDGRLNWTLLEENGLICIEPRRNVDKLLDPFYPKTLLEILGASNHMARNAMGMLNNNEFARYDKKSLTVLLGRIYGHWLGLCIAARQAGMDNIAEFIEQYFLEPTFGVITANQDDNFWKSVSTPGL